MTTMYYPAAQTKTQMKVVVTVTGTDVPPGWQEQTLAKVTREMELMFGVHASVKPKKGKR